MCVGVHACSRERRTVLDGRVTLVLAEKLSNMNSVLVSRQSGPRQTGINGKVE